MKTILPKSHTPEIINLMRQPAGCRFISAVFILRIDDPLVVDDDDGDDRLSLHSSLKIFHRGLHSSSSVERS